ncbi:MAG: NFACT RNA binding domain-containing protein, partial [Clostridia bacterium]|nr:NFACT RNA binding domain-containing protein [Clostridia bacterium]
MPLDGITLHAIVKELSDLSGASVQKVHQPERDEILLLLHTQNGNKKLLISASPQSPRIHLTEANYKNPENPPMFCMLLRKHFTGGKIVSFSQSSLDRVVDMAFECHNELGDTVIKHIIVEIMGRNSNLIITDENYKIYDCLRKNDISTEHERMMLPGFIYEFPENNGKCDILTASDETIIKLLKDANGKDLINLLVGFSPLAGREAEHHGNIADYVINIRNNLIAGKFSPTLILGEEKPFDFWCFDILEYESGLKVRKYSSVGEMLEAYYFEKSYAEHMKQKNSALVKLVSNLLGRAERKLKLQYKELSEAGKKDEFKVMGDLITANLYKIKQGAKMAEVSDWSTGEEVILHIPLDESISPSDNAQRYYRKYAKAKNAETVIGEQIKLTCAEMEYLKSVLQSVNDAENMEDIAQIKEELAEGGYIKGETGKKKKQISSKPLEFSVDGFNIYVGKNNKQNDLLTLKTARANDIWLHVKNNAGSHVIIETKGKDVPSSVIEYAA